MHHAHFHYAALRWINGDVIQHMLSIHRYFLRYQVMNSAFQFPSFCPVLWMPTFSHLINGDISITLTTRSSQEGVLSVVLPTPGIAFRKNE